MEDRIGELEKRIAELECQFQAQQKRYKELIEDKRILHLLPNNLVFITHN